MAWRACFRISWARASSLASAAGADKRTRDKIRRRFLMPVFARRTEKVPHDYEMSQDYRSDSGESCESWVVRSLKLRRRRWLIGAQGSSIARTLGTSTGNTSNPERVRQLANAFSVPVLFKFANPGLSLRSNRWAEISERLRR